MESMIGSVSSPRYEANAIKAEPEARTLIARLDKVHAMLLECQGIAGRAGDKLVGSEPAPGVTGEKDRPEPNGFLAELNERASRMSESVSRLHAYLQRIDRVF